MDLKYIVAIAALSVFCVLFLIFFVLLAHKRKMEAKLHAWLYEVYSDKNLIKKINYDTPSLDDEISQLNERGGAEEQDAANQEANDEQLKIEEAFTKIDSEGIEEITGNYKPQ